jgi:hypothetical protein
VLHPTTDVVVGGVAVTWRAAPASSQTLLCVLVPTSGRV